MSFRIAFDARNRILVVTPDGGGSVPDVLTVLRAMAAHPSFGDATGVVSDQTGTTWVSDYAASELLADAYAAGPLVRLPVAVVADGDLQYAAGAQWAALAGLRGAT